MPLTIKLLRNAYYYSAHLLSETQHRYMPKIINFSLALCDLGLKEYYMLLICRKGIRLVVQEHKILL
jgi:hypothetical protein